MATSEVVYIGELSTTATHLKSSSTLQTDAPVDNNGLGGTFSPTDLLATSLASCMLTIAGIQAAKMKIDISGMKASVTKIMASSPRRVAEIIVDVTLTDRGLTRSQKAALEKAARNCPVALSLSESLKQSIRFTYEA